MGADVSLTTPMDDARLGRMTTGGGGERGERGDWGVAAGGADAGADDAG
jgi:hypothetical protein